MNRLSIFTALALGLLLSVSHTRSGHAQTGNFSDVTGFNLTNSSLVPVGSAIDGSNSWQSANMQEAVNNAVASISGGSFAVQEVVVSNSGQPTESSKVTLNQTTGNSVTISFSNGTQISSLISVGDSTQFQAPSFTSDARGQIEASQITNLPDNALNNAIKSFVNTNETHLDAHIMSLTVDLAMALQAIQKDEVVSPSHIANAITSFNALVNTAQQEEKLDQLSDGVYGAYAALSSILNRIEATLESDLAE